MNIRQSVNVLRPSLTADLIRTASTIARRIALALLLFGAGFVILQLSSRPLFAFENSGDLEPRRSLPETGAPSELASGSWTPTGSLLTARYLHTLTLLPSGKVLVAAGFNGPPGEAGWPKLASAELYDPMTGSWTSTGSLGAARGHHTATLLPNGKVLVAGGVDGTAPGTLEIYPASTELYDPASGSWTPTGSLVAPRKNHTETLLPNGKVLVAGGFRFGDLNHAELYDPASGTWTATAPLGAARSFHTATLLTNGKVLVTGGYKFSSSPSGPLASAEVYDPAAGTWTPTGSLGTARAYHTATLLPNGKVLVAAGSTNNVFLASAELYDPATGTWTATGSLRARFDHTATLLPDNKVLVVGGNNNTADLYDIATGTWTEAGNLASNRNHPAAALLANEKVLVAGGRNEDGPMASCELYDPSATPSPTPTPTSTPARSLNIATRAQVQTGNNVMIGGFIVTGNVSKKVIVRAIGPSLMKSGLTGVLADPFLELRAPNGSLIRANDNWRENADQALLIQASGIPPQDDLESAIVATLPPAGYTAVVRGKSGGTGLGLVEIYDLEESTDSRLANLSTRAVVGTGNNVMIGGFILGGTSGTPRIFVRALGPSLTRFGISDALPDPTLELRDENGSLIAFNDNWDENPAQASQITAAGMQPQEDLEAVIAITPPPGTYTAIAIGKAQGTGVGLVEVYNLQ